MMEPETTKDTGGIAQGGTSPENAEYLVLQELLAARKTTEGLSPHTMALCPTLTGLLGDGDPMAAFGRLQTKTLEALELGDDVQALEAATYSLGLTSHGKTHLDRLNDFGEVHGYEARQARRYSDKGIKQLARLVCTNWVFQTAPTAEVTLAQQIDGTTIVTIRTMRQRFIRMRPLSIVQILDDGTAEPCAPDAVVNEQPLAPGSHGDLAENGDLPADLWYIGQLNTPLLFSPPRSDHPISLEVSWKGEIWPIWRVTLMALQPDYVATSQALAAGLIVTIQPLSAWRMTPSTSPPPLRSSN